jgi:alpha-tubulin suppressor-like RCC1 family protein
MKIIFAFSCLTLLCIQALADQVKLTGSLWGMGADADGQLAAGFILLDTNRPYEMISSNVVTAVSAGENYSLWLESDGSLWGVGEENSGQLGNGTYGNTTGGYTIVPVEIETNGVVAVSAGYDFSLFLKNDGTLWGMGDESAGALGNGTYGTPSNYTTNLPVEITNGVTAISAGYQDSLFIRTNGSLWGMGANSYGELGNGTVNPTDVPIEIVASNVTAIDEGWFFSLFVKSDGTLWGMGFNPWGNLGDGTTHTTSIPVEITNGVTAVAAGGDFSLFMKSDGTLWGMGDNYYGELGYGTNSGTSLPVEITNGVTAIFAGEYHSLFIKTDGSLWVMGNNEYGQLGDGISAGGQTNLPEEIEPNGVIAIGAGYSHSLFVMGPPPGYNEIAVRLLIGGSVSLSFVGTAGTSYELDRSFSLSPPVWVPQLTNAAGAGGILVFTNTPNPTTNDFWRIRSVP